MATLVHEEISSPHQPLTWMQLGGLVQHVIHAMPELPEPLFYAEYFDEADREQVSVGATDLPMQNYVRIQPSPDEQFLRVNDGYRTFVLVASGQQLLNEFFTYFYSVLMAAQQSNRFPKYRSPTMALSPFHKHIRSMPY